MADMEIWKEHHHDGDGDGDDGNKKNGDDKKRKASEKSTTDHLDDDDDDNFKKKIKKGIVNLREGEEMPVDIIWEVYLRLPPVSVIRLVRALLPSENLFLVISDPFFLREHAVFHYSQLLREPPGILICPSHTDNKHPVYAIPPQLDDDDDQEDPPLKKLLDRFLPEFNTRFPTSIIVDSCNGLLLYCESRIADTHVNHNSRPDVINIIVCNPLLNQHKFIIPIRIVDLVPSFKNPEKVIIKGYPHLIFDPSISLSYKVVIIIHAPDSNEFQLHVYSSETEGWTYINTVAQDGRQAEYWESTLFNGVWFCVRDDDILCFDVRENTITSFINLPQKPEGSLVREVYYFGECAGQLQLIQDYDAQVHWFPFKFTLMEMENLVLGQPTTWIDISRVNINSGFDHIIQGLGQGGIKVMHPYKTGAYQAVILNIDNRRFVSFNITTATFGKELTIPYLENSNNLEAFPFTPTLFPLLP